MIFSVDEIYNRLIEFLPVEWDGKESIDEMKRKGCRNWKQMEWPGFYFQEKCEEILGMNGFFEVPGPQYGKASFDGFRSIPWDFKAHTMKNSPTSELVPTNDYEAVCNGIAEHGKVGFIIACGDAEYDNEEYEFKVWHDQLKGKTSQYEKERILRDAPSRRRKKSFTLTHIMFVFVDINTIGYCGEFQKGMRNSNGKPRRRKVMLNLCDNRLEKVSFRVGR